MYAHQRTESKASGLRNEIHQEPSQEHLSDSAYADPYPAPADDPYAAYGPSSAYAQPQVRFPSCISEVLS